MQHALYHATNCYFMHIKLHCTKQDVTVAAVMVSSSPETLSLSHLQFPKLGLPEAREASDTDLSGRY